MFWNGLCSFSCKFSNCSKSIFEFTKLIINTVIRMNFDGLRGSNYVCGVKAHVSIVKMEATINFT